MNPHGPIKSVYIAGPMRGYEDFNFPAFDRAAKQLREWGFTVFNPAEHDRNTYGDRFHSPNGADTDVPGFSLRNALTTDLTWIAQEADAVCLLEGWAESKGAKAEKALADALGLSAVHEASWWALIGRCQVFDPEPTDEEIIAAIDAVVMPHRRSLRDSDLDGHDECDPGQCETKMAAVMESESEEVRSVSSTGAMKGTKLAAFDLIPPHALTEVAKHYGRTAVKYPAGNWRLGYEWSKSYAALMRHVTQWWAGENEDAELNTPHLAAAAWHCLTLLEFAKTHGEMDDRPAR